ncbi:MAG TPA: GNAT family N-acetyltransferase [Myxococcales bacterium]|nr:GNAT family N-acetyltransferase [Myxococcales bacterium]
MPSRFLMGRSSDPRIDPSMPSWSCQPNADPPGPQRRVGTGYCERVTLPDGTRVVLRPIHAADQPLVQECLRGVSERTRYLRFHSPRAGLDPEELRSFTDVDGETRFALGAFLPSSLRLVAVAQFFRGSVASAGAEIALLVTDALQGKGLGRLLVSRLREAAAERSITHFAGWVLEENEAMRGFLRTLGARIGLPSRGVCFIELAT